MNFYEILEIHEMASSDEIKKAYKHLATKYHPDKHDNDSFFEKKFKELNEAYSTLSDSQKRKDYDFQLNATKSEKSKKSYNVVDELLRKEKELDKKAKHILYASEEIVINKLYINVKGKSYPLKEIDAVTINKDESKRNTWAWFFLVTGLLTIIVGVGFLLLLISIILFVLPRDYLLILISREGGIPIIKGIKKDLSPIKDIIDKEIKTQHNSGHARQPGG